MKLDEKTKQEKPIMFVVSLHLTCPPDQGVSSLTDF